MVLAHTRKPPATGWRQGAAGMSADHDWIAGTVSGIHVQDQRNGGTQNQTGSGQPQKSRTAFLSGGFHGPVLIKRFWIQIAFFFLQHNPHCFLNAEVQHVKHTITGDKDQQPCTEQQDPGNEQCVAQQVIELGPGSGFKPAPAEHHQKECDCGKEYVNG